MSPRAPVRSAATGGRLREGPSRELIASAYRLELQSAPALMPELVLADLAHILVLLDEGLIPLGPGKELLGALLELREAGPRRQSAGASDPGDPGAIHLDAALGDLVMNREAWLRERIGRTAGYLLVGRPRREAVTVAFHLAVRYRLIALGWALDRLQRELVDMASAHAGALAVDYTYWQAAQPTTLGHALLSYAFPLGRDAARLREAYRRVNASPAGAGCTNGPGIPIDRRALAGLLGFDGVVPHARDANWQADVALELTAVSASVALTLDRLAEDLQVWGTREFGFAELADRATRVSLAMPQKKNPYALVFVRGVAARMIGRLAAAGAVAKTATGQPDPRIFAQDEVPGTIELARQATAVMADALSGIRFDREKLAAGARRGYLAGNDLAERIMYRRDMPFGDAHRIVGAAVRIALDAGRDEDGIDAASLDRAAIETIGVPVGLADEDVRDALDPDAAVARRTGIGGAAPEAVRELIAGRRRALRRDRRWLEDRERAVENAEAGLLARARNAVAA
jgi:argininosuccinate lyase